MYKAADVQHVDIGNMLLK